MSPTELHVEIYWPRDVRKPNGEIVQVDRLAFNLAVCVAPTSYVQCSDASWIRADKLTPVSAAIANAGGRA
jgi:hypothetical protein